MAKRFFVSLKGVEAVMLNNPTSPNSLPSSVSLTLLHKALSARIQILLCVSQETPLPAAKQGEGKAEAGVLVGGV